MRLVLGITAFPRHTSSGAISRHVALGGVRVFSRILAESLQRKSAQHINVILIGAGAAAERTLREIARPEATTAQSVVDDNISKTGEKIHESHPWQDQ